MNAMQNPLFDFLTRLAANNNRPWFQENKPEFDALREQWYADLDRLIAVMTTEIPELASQTGRTASYRIYRDTRFSLDKTPYKTYFSALISPWGRKLDRAAYYIHVGIEECGLYTGIWNPPSPMLRKLRHAMIDNIDEFEEIINNPALKEYFHEWAGDRLKTVPKGWDRNHPYAHLLRLKDIGLVNTIDRDFFNNPDWPEVAARRLLLTRPLVDFLNYSIDEETYS